MKYLGIDYGGKRVGVAVSNSEGTIAFPRETLMNDDQLVARIKEFAEKEKVAAIVIGDTRTVSGAVNPVTAAAEALMEQVARETGIPLSRAFEAWTSIEASRYAPKGKEHDDAAAAAVILQRFLDMHTGA